MNVSSVLLLFFSIVLEENCYICMYICMRECIHLFSNCFRCLLVLGAKGLVVRKGKHDCLPHGAYSLMEVRVTK